MADKHIIDVSQPGKTPAESTSRPIIVANRSMVKDPTVNDPEDEKPSTHEDDKITKSEAKPIAPISPELAKSEPEESKPPESEAAPEKPSKPEDKAEPTDQTDKQQHELTASEKAHQEAVAKLATSGKYVVPVGHIERNQRLRKMLTILVLILLLGLIAGDLLIDGGVIKTSIKPPINLINN